MNIQAYGLTFKASVVGLKDLNEYQLGDLHRSFIDFIKAKGLEFNFLVDGVSVETDK